MTIPRVLVIDRCEDCLYCNQAAQWCGHSEAPGAEVRLSSIPSWCPLPGAHKLLTANKEVGHYKWKEKDKMKKHNHEVTSNTDKVFRTFIGEPVKGIVHNYNYGHTQTILVFDCGWGLALSSNGSHWVENPETVERLKDTAMAGLETTKRELENILKLSGETL